MSSFDKDRTNYLKDIRNGLPLRDKRGFIDELSVSIDEYQASIKDCNIEQIIQHFGTPQEIINSYIESIDVDLLKKSVNKTKWLKIGIEIIIIFYILLYIISFFRGKDLIVSTVNDTIDGEIVEEIVEE